MFAFQLNFSSFNTIGQGSPVISHTPAAKEGTICMFVFVCACMCMYVCTHAYVYVQVFTCVYIVLYMCMCVVCVCIHEVCMQ